jgi:ABC-type glycerol-3-phosphate transport system permease component
LTERFALSRVPVRDLAGQGLGRSVALEMGIRYENQIALIMAGMVVATTPILVLYIAFRRYFIRGIKAGAVK